MATLESVIQKINLLIEDANDTTGSLHNNLRDAVDALILGYGGYGNIEVDSLSDIHLWSKYTIPGTVTETKVDTLYISRDQTGIDSVYEPVDYADEYDIPNGKIVLVNPTENLTFTSSTTAQVLLGKYIQTYEVPHEYATAASPSGKFYRIDSTADIEYNRITYPTTGRSLRVSPAYRLNYADTEERLVGIVVSDDINAYPQNGEQDGYKYVYNGTLDDTDSDLVLQNKFIIPSTSQQVVRPDSNYDALSEVTVAGDANLVASNIKKGVSIFYVNGTYEGAGGTTLPTLTNPGVAEDLLAGKELIDENGNVITGTAVDKRTVLDSVDVTPEVLTVGRQTYIMHQYTPSKTMMVRDAVKLCASTYKFGNATADDVVAGKTFTSASGLKVTGTHECSGGTTLPTLTTPGSSDDLAKGKQLIDADGNVVTGTVPVVTMVTTTQGDTFVSFDAEGKQITMSGKLGERKIVDGNANVLMVAPASEFGDASASDVAKGKTFTSAAGRKVVGTMEHGGGFTVTDDGAGNVTITSSAITDNNGNVVIA